jgi:hypothetical protein
MREPSVVDVLIAIPVLPLLPVVATWFLPWEDWIPKKVPKVVLGPYLLYAAFASWHFWHNSFTCFLIIGIGLAVCLGVLWEKITDYVAK